MLGFAVGERIQQVGRMGRRSLQTRLSSTVGGGQETRLGVGHEEHQQPQRPHPQEVLSGGTRLQPAMCPHKQRYSPSPACHLRQGQE